MQLNLTFVVAACAALCMTACDAKDGGPDEDPAEAMSPTPEATPEVGESADNDDGDDDGDGDGDTAASDSGGEDPGPRAVGLLEGECVALGVEVTCAVDDAMGVQFCDPYDESWGPCLFGLACDVGDIQQGACGPGDETTPLACELRAGVPTWQECGFTPLVLSFDGREPTFDAGPDAFELSGGSNACIAREMPSAETPWLAMDRDGSGAIENGSELFGSASPTLDGRKPSDGFDALADLDTNHDGKISAADDAWTSLVLWSDYDRNRASSPWELLAIEYSGVTEIALSHRDDRRCDSHGNCGVQRSAFAFSTPAGTPTTGTVVDVHIPCD